jgi:two-component system nitrate/nitrite response regulator NarL
VARGENYLEARYLKPIFQKLDTSAQAGSPQLSDREVLMIRLIFEGLSNKEIGERLSLSESAVKAALRVLFDKLGVRTRSQLVKVALEQYRDQL